MRFDGTCWRTNNEEDSVRICDDSMHPGITGDVARRWQSDRNGTVTLEISVSKRDTSGGDGVILQLYRNTTLLRGWQFGPNDSQGINSRFIVNLNQGDYLFFVLKVNQNSANDETNFAVRILP